jgi:AcrR family transcriptional regulator
VPVSIQCVSTAAIRHTALVPQHWVDTMAAHRQTVRDTVLDVTAELVAEHGVAGVSMSRIAERAGIGRATLYKYFPDLDAVLAAWHERVITDHLQHLAAVSQQAAAPTVKLTTVLRHYAESTHQRHDSDLAALLHQGPHLRHAQQQLRALLRDLLAEAARTGEIRADIAPDELAAYCLHALTAASTLRSKAAVRRLVGVTLAGLRP